MDIINRINYTRFLGREFLTWLWYRSDIGEGRFDIGQGPIELWFDAKLTLEALGDVKEQNVIKAENPTEQDEAHTALASGKVVSEARLRMVKGQKQWVFNVKGDTLGMSSVKIPALLSRDDDDQLYERFYLLEEIEEDFNALFKEFITLRLDDDAWREELNQIRRWIQPDAEG